FSSSRRTATAFIRPSSFAPPPREPSRVTRVAKASTPTPMLSRFWTSVKKLIIAPALELERDHFLHHERAHGHHQHRDERHELPARIGEKLGHVGRRREADEDHD